MGQLSPFQPTKKTSKTASYGWAIGSSSLELGPQPVPHDTSAHRSRFQRLRSSDSTLHSTINTWVCFRNVTALKWYLFTFYLLILCVLCTGLDIWNQLQCKSFSISAACPSFMRTQELRRISEVPCSISVWRRALEDTSTANPVFLEEESQSWDKKLMLSIRTRQIWWRLFSKRTVFLRNSLRISHVAWSAVVVSCPAVGGQGVSSTEGLQLSPVLLFCGIRRKQPCQQVERQQDLTNLTPPISCLDARMRWQCSIRQTWVSWNCES